MKIIKKSSKDLSKIKGPSDQEIKKYMENNNISFYEARERLRELAYSGKPPHGYPSWGDYWKAY